MTHFEAIVALLVGIITMLTALCVGLRWVYRQGAANTELKRSVDLNTAATQDLTVSYRAFTVKIQDTMLDHERRLTRLETTTELSRARGG